jgi:hypothetical protein
MGFSYGKSTSWAISVSLGAGAVTYVGASVYLAALFDVQHQIFFPAFLAGASAGAGFKGGLSVATFSPTFFTVSEPMYASDFDNCLCAIGDISLIFGVGGSATGMTIYGVSHNPSVLSIGGVGAGLSAGLTLSPLLYLYVRDQDAVQNKGCLITPVGDPLCGGQSKKSPNRSVDTGVSR